MKNLNANVKPSKKKKKMCLKTENSIFHLPFQKKFENSTDVRITTYTIEFYFEEISLGSAIVQGRLLGEVNLK